MNYKSNITKMYVFEFLLGLHFISAVLIPFFTEYGKLNFTQIMLLQSWFAFWIFALEVPTGTIADKFGRKFSITLGAFVIAIAALVYASYASIWIFLLAEFLFALGISLDSGANEALVYDSLKKMKQEHKAKKVFANMQTAHLLAIALGAVAGSVIASIFGVRATMGAMAITALAGAILMLTVKEVKFRRKKESESKSYWKTLTEGVLFLKKHKILWILALESSLIATISFFIIWVYQVKLTELKVALVLFGLVHTGMCLSQILVMQNFKKLEELLKSKKSYILFSTILVGISFILLGLTQNAVIAVIAILVIGGFGLTIDRYFASFMNSYIESHHRATVLSTISMIKTFFRSIAYPVIGLLVDWSVGITFIILGAIVIALAFSSRIEEEHLAE